MYSIKYNSVIFSVIILFAILIFPLKLIANKTEIYREISWQRPPSPPLWWTNIEEWKLKHNGDWYIIASELVESENEAYKQIKNNSVEIIKRQADEVIEFNTYFIRAYNIGYNYGKNKITERKFICYGLFQKIKIKHPLNVEFNNRINMAEKHLQNGDLDKALYDYEAAEYIRLNNPELNLPMSISEIKKINTLQNEYQNNIEKVQHSYIKKNYSQALDQIDNTRNFMKTNNININTAEIDMTEKKIFDAINSFKIRVENIKNQFKSNRSVFNEVIQIIHNYYSFNEFNFDSILKENYDSLFTICNSNNIKLSDYYVFIYYNIPENISYNRIEPVLTNYYIIGAEYSSSILADYFNNRININITEEEADKSIFDSEIITKNYSININVYFNGKNYKYFERINETGFNIFGLNREVTNKIQKIIQKFIDSKLL